MNAATALAPPRARFPSALIDRIRLDDGRSVVVRPVLPLDADAEQEFVRALSNESRRKRFHVLLRELPPGLLRQMTEVDHVDHVAIVAEAFADDDDAAQIVADARYVRDGDETHLAIAVADAWQRIGLGGALVQRLLAHAARHGVVRLVADMLSSNTEMARLAARFGAHFGASPNGPGLRRARFEVGGAA